jgi:hypothetical protein
MCAIKTRRRLAVQDSILLSGRDSFLVSIPFLILLAVSIFRLDATLAVPNRPARRQPPARGIDENGEPIFTDPDGRRTRLRRRNTASKPRKSSPSRIVEGAMADKGGSIPARAEKRLTKAA